jgi:nitrate reductase gamma subunit
MAGSVLLVLCYALLSLFAVAFVVKVVKIAKLPMHLRWELAPVPKEKTRGRYGGSYLEEYEWWKKPREESLVSELTFMGKEIIFLKALWEHKRGLWWVSFPFHMGLYLLIAGGGLLVLDGILEMAGFSGSGRELLGSGIPLLVVAGHVLGTIGAFGLLLTRIIDRNLAVMTSRVAYFNLLLVLGVCATGVLAILSVPDFTGGMAGIVGDLLAANSSIAASGMLAVHLLVTLVFLAYLPFSQMMHFVAKYFTYHQVRWDDRPMEAGSQLEKDSQELLGQTVTWGADHIGADGKKNWVDLATEEVKK